MEKNSRSVLAALRVIHRAFIRWEMLKNLNNFNEYKSPRKPTMLKQLEKFCAVWCDRRLEAQHRYIHAFHAVIHSTPL